ncbi:MAG: hypothetical protein M3R38_08315 [Actinomycetota bacterium]|nr:hypothetical protein [Actinomycetota bacterium]
MAAARGGPVGTNGSSRTSPEDRVLAVFCAGVSGSENGGRPAYGFAVARGVKPSAGPPGAFPKRRRYSRGGGERGGLPAEGLEWDVVHLGVALLGGGPDDWGAGLGEEALAAVAEYRAVGAALAWLEGRGCRRDRLLLFTRSKTLARLEEEPFGVWRASRRPVEGEALREVLGAVARFGDLSAEWWRPGCPHRPEELAVLAGEVAGEISARARVAVLEESRTARAKEVRLEKIGRGLYRANGRYVVDVLFGFCGCRDFEVHNGKKRGKGRAVVVRCKHLIAAEEAEGDAESSGRGVLGPAST